MPQVIDATVVNQLCDTSGNGGRKLVRLSNGWFVSLTQETSNPYRTFIKVYKPEEQNPSWQDLCYIDGGMTAANARLLSIANYGDRVFIFGWWNKDAENFNFFNFDATTQTNVDIWSTKQVVSVTSHNSLSSSAISMEVNESDNSVHVAMSYVRSSHPDSNNIFYVKGTINEDGSVSWGAVEQVTKINHSGSDYVNPTITIASNNLPVIIADQFGIISFRYDGMHWYSSVVYNNDSYAQSNPSACVDKNGRIWVTWHGKDSTDTNVNNIRVAYSDDGGATWSSMTKLTNGNSYGQESPSITANINNEIFIVWHGRDGTDSRTDIRMIKYSGSWSSVSVISAGTTNDKAHASTLYDATFDFSTPLFIYRDYQGNKVGFYGTWAEVNISVPQGHIGKITDKNNLLSYNITTDGEMSEVVEKINGVTITTKTLESGEDTIVSVSQNVWDDVRFGKYKDATGAKNTLTIEMGNNKWEYPFEKALPQDANILSAVKAVKDVNEVVLPAVKSELASAIRDKGGSVGDIDSFENLIEGLGSIIIGKRHAMGTVVASSPLVTVSGLDFKPSIVIVMSTNLDYSLTLYLDQSKYPLFSNVKNNHNVSFYQGNRDSGRNSVGENSFSFRLYASTTNNTCRWIAIE